MGAMARRESCEPTSAFSAHFRPPRAPFALRFSDFCELPAPSSQLSGCCVATSYDNAFPDGSNHDGSTKRNDGRNRARRFTDCSARIEDGAWTCALRLLSEVYLAPRNPPIIGRGLSSGHSDECRIEGPIDRASELTPVRPPVSKPGYKVMPSSTRRRRPLVRRRCGRVGIGVRADGLPWTARGLNRRKEQHTAWQLRHGGNGRGAGSRISLLIPASAAQRPPRCLRPRRGP
jgi:hypothetical protein